MGTHVDEMREWAESFTNHFVKLAQTYEHSYTHAGLCNSILLGLMKGKSKKSFFVPNELIEQFREEKKGFFITCHGMDKRGRVKYVVEVKENSEE